MISIFVFIFQETKDDVIVLRFVTYMVYFPLIVVMLILNCFGDATPEYLDFDRGEVKNLNTGIIFSCVHICVSLFFFVEFIKMLRQFVNTRISYFVHKVCHYQYTLCLHEH